jgi:CTP:molybdopterin cytidylyltransferase MocA
MGYPKGLIKINAKSIINHHIDKYSKIIAGKITILLGQDLPLYNKEIINKQTIIIHNKQIEKGQFYSTKLGLKELSSSGLATFITTIDKLPPSLNTIQKMYDSFSTNDSLVTVPCFNDKNGHPVLLHNLFCEKLLRLDEKHPESRLDLQIKMISKNKKKYVEVDDNTIHGNFNTVADLPKAKLDKTSTVK